MIKSPKPWNLYGGITIFALIDLSMAIDTEKPRTAYPAPFARPSSAGNDYNTWRDAKGPDVGKTAVKSKRLPSRVDNSKRPEYPPIYQQKWGTCGQHAAIASVFTYEMNVLRGTKADTDATRFPAYFSWNMVNEAKDAGSEAFHGWEVAKEIGIPTSKSYGGVPPEQIGGWPSGYDIWREAMEYRVSGYRYSPVGSVAQLDEARGWLYDRNRPVTGQNPTGGIFAMDGRMGDLPKITVTIPAGSYAEGEELWTDWNSDGFGHGLTCVGYDDEVGFDLNKDGKITNDVDTNKDGKVDLADWERGAFIVVNSWGVKWSGDGCIYLLYSAMVDPNWERGNYLGRVEVVHQIPKMTLRMKLSCDDRSNLRVNVGMAKDSKAKVPSSEFSPAALNGWPIFGQGSAGHVPMAGPGDSSPIEIGLDLTSLVEMSGYKLGDKGRIFLSLSRADGSKAEGKLEECAVLHYDAKGELKHESVIEQTERNFGQAGLKINALLN